MFHNKLDEKSTYSVNNYIGVYYPTHPFCWQNGTVYYHRLVMENYLDRYLDIDEHVHHIDGNPQNNNIDNLELMTNELHLKLHNPIYLKEKLCKYCGKLFKPRQNRIIYCSPECGYLNKRKVIHPTKEQLEILIWAMPTTKLAKKFGVSDKAISSWCKLYGIPKPPRGYWS